jgi:hypothetical protein
MRNVVGRDFPALPICVAGFRNVESYCPATRKLGHYLLCVLERVLAGKPLTFDQASDAA